MSRAATAAEPAVEGLHPSAPAALPFGRALEIRAFLLRRERGNLLVYSVPGVGFETSALEGLGGVSRQYLNHRHEAAMGPDGIAAPLFCHENERDSVSQVAHVRASFSKGHVLEDFEVVPTPGHTSGATAYLWDTGSRRLLFSGDTILLSNGEWRAAVLDSSDREDYLRSLELIRELDFDVLVPWVSTAGHPHLAETDRDDARRRIDAIIARVRRGEGG